MTYIHSCELSHLFVQECPPGYYGNDCRYQCSVNCYGNRSCDQSTGQCEGGCQPGWSGDTCDQCNSLTFFIDA